LEAKGGTLELHDRIDAGAVLALGSAVIFFSRQLTYWNEYAPGPGFFPFWIGVGFILCGLLLSLRKTPPKSAEKRRPFWGQKTWKAGFILVTLAAAVLLVPVLGLPIGLGLFAGLTMRAAGRHSWILCWLVAFATAAGVQFIFGACLDIPLPKCMLGW